MSGSEFGKTYKVFFCNQYFCSLRYGILSNENADKLQTIFRLTLHYMSLQKVIFIFKKILHFECITSWCCSKGGYPYVSWQPGCLTTTASDCYSLKHISCCPSLHMNSELHAFTSHWVRSPSLLQCRLHLPWLGPAGGRGGQARSGARWSLGKLWQRRGREGQGGCGAGNWGGGADRQSGKGGTVWSPITVVLL